MTFYNNMETKQELFQMTDKNYYHEHLINGLIVIVIGSSFLIGCAVFFMSVGFLAGLPIFIFTYVYLKNMYKKDEKTINDKKNETAEMLQDSDVGRGEQITRVLNDMKLDVNYRDGYWILNGAILYDGIGKDIKDIADAYILAEKEDIDPVFILVENNQTNIDLVEMHGYVPITTNDVLDAMIYHTRYSK